ncbi:hypothetical protein DFH09DRAFT_1275968 [Mycena vulgaris]|nr:hypothetical protein DFH09DRAFT_1275968 [Mycena vulgaris]
MLSGPGSPKHIMGAEKPMESNIFEAAISSVVHTVEFNYTPGSEEPVSIDLPALLVWKDGDKIWLVLGQKHICTYAVYILAHAKYDGVAEYSDCVEDMEDGNEEPGWEELEATMNMPGHTEKWWTMPRIWTSRATRKGIFLGCLRRMGRFSLPMSGSRNECGPIGSAQKRTILVNEARGREGFKFRMPEWRNDSRRLVANSAHNPQQFGEHIACSGE